MPKSEAELMDRAALAAKSTDSKFAKPAWEFAVEPEISTEKNESKTTFQL